jgi:hypothetical protein
MASLKYTAIKGIYLRINAPNKRVDNIFNVEPASSENKARRQNFFFGDFVESTHCKIRNFSDKKRSDIS